MDELNKKIALWCGFRLGIALVGHLWVGTDSRERWLEPGGAVCAENDPPDFLDPFMGIANQIRWVWPKLDGIIEIAIVLPEKDDDTVDVHLLRLEDDVLSGPFHGQGKNAGEAGAQAIGKYIDSLEA